MCGRFILTQNALSLKTRFRIDIPDGRIQRPSYNISPGQKTAVITGERPHELQLYCFGMTNCQMPKQELLINVRSEGNFNPSNDPDYQGEMGIFNDPDFSGLIRSQRCLIPADAYIEVTAGLKFNKPYLIYLRDKIRPFAFAGIWDVCTHTVTGEPIRAFAILTTFPNRLAARLQHHRMPVILCREDEERWLSPGISDEELSSMMRPYPAERMNGYPIAPTIKNPKANDPGLIHPAGPRIFPVS